MFVLILSIVTLLLNVAMVVYVGRTVDRTHKLLRSVQRKLRQEEPASGFERRLWDLQGQRFGRQMSEEPRKR